MFKKILTKTNILLFLILCVAAFMRLYRIADYLTFLGDEGRDVLVVWNILHGHPTLLGPTASVGGFFLGPIYYYFMTPFLWLFNYNPVGPAVMVALFGIATVWLIYFVTSKFFNKKAGLVAAFLFSVSPLVIAYSRSSWNPNPLPFFSLLCLYFLYIALNRNSKKYLIFSGILLGIAMQLHYLATFLAVIIALYIFSDGIYQIWRKAKWRGVLVATIINYLVFFVGYIIGWSPFLLFEVRHGFSNIKSIINFVLFSKETGGGVNFLSTVNNVFFRIFGRLITDYPPPEQVSLAGHINITIWYLSTLLLALSSTIFLFWTFIKSLKKREDFLQKSLLFLWFVIGILLFGFYKKEIYDYYFAFLFPLPFLLVGGLFYFISKLNKFWLGVCVLAFIILSIVNIQALPFRYPANRQLAQVEGISSFVYSKTDGKPFNFALITGGNSDYAYRYFFTVWGHPPVTIENVISDPQRKTVTNQLLIVCEIECHPLGDSLWEVAGFGRAQIAGKWDVSVVKVYKLIHYEGK
ncbi:MAG TPA: glycosyltransferase family 39 protein [Patescibacteria group bacterium]